MKDKSRIIDDCLEETINKYYMKIKNNEKLNNIHIQLLSNIIACNYNCIAPGNARDDLKKLGQTNILFELLKNIVKLNSYYKMNNLNRKIVNKTLDNSNLTTEEIELLVYDEIIKGNIDDVFKKLQVNKTLLLGLIISFVNSRYNQETKIKNIDVVRNTSDLILISKLDQFCLI